MKIDIVSVGQLQANCYILTYNDDVIIIDPGAEAEKIDKCIKGNVVAILLTHHHFDHIGALSYFKNKYQCDIYDYYNLKEGNQKISSFDLEIIYTKGHTDDSITYYFYRDNIMFTGDFLFKDTIGRTDLESGNINDMIDSLNKIKKYDGNIKLYPGHGDMTTLDSEISNNLFFRY